MSTLINPPSLTYIFLIAFALGLDAFSVALAAGICVGKTQFRQKFRLSFHFGLFQFLMTLIGWLVSSEIVKYISDYAHWVACLILSIIGFKMIVDSLSSRSEQIIKDISKGFTLVSLSIATSLDALAVGFSMGVIKHEILIPSIIIGITASIMTLSGIKLGEILSIKFSHKVSIIGGIILIFIGIHIVVQH